MLTGTAIGLDGAFGGATVRAYMGGRTALATTTTDADGRFSLTFEHGASEGRLVTVVATKGSQTLAGVAVIGAIVATGGGNLRLLEEPPAFEVTAASTLAVARSLGAAIVAPRSREVIPAPPTAA